VPDDQDYEWLRWLVDHPEQWTDKDLSAARFMISSLKRAIEDMHSKDLMGRRRAQEVVDRLEAAVQSYLSRLARRTTREAYATFSALLGLPGSLGRESRSPAE
jgi:hypothetical protein